MAGIDEYTVLMLHCDGSDAVTSFPDSSFTPHSVTANADAQVDTAQYKFNGASGLFDGDGDYLSAPSNSDWYFDGDFTVDFWVRIDETTNYTYFFGQYQDGDNRLFMQHNNTSDNLQFYARVGGSERFNVQATCSLSADTWHHIALVRSGNSWYIFLDGIDKTQSGGTDSDSYPNLNATFDIGCANDASGRKFELDDGTAYDKWIDEFRVSKGIARWTTGFSVPAAPYSRNTATGSADILYDFGGRTILNDHETVLYNYGGYTVLNVLDSFIYDFENKLTDSSPILYNFSGVISKQNGILYNFNNQLSVTKRIVYDYIHRTPDAVWIEPSPDFANDAVIVRWKYNLPDGWNTDREIPIQIFLNGNLYDESYGNFMHLTGLVGVNQEIYVWAKARPGQRYTGITPKANRAKITCNVNAESDIVKVEIFTDNRSGNIELDDVYGTILVPSGTTYFGKVDAFDRNEITV